MDYFANTCASVAGLLLFCIGVIGLSGMPFVENPLITSLLQPLGQSERVDQTYYFALILVGVWLVLYIQARFAALVALALVFAKILVV